MIDKLTKIILSCLILFIPITGFTVEINPFKYIKSEQAGGNPIALYKINNNYNSVYVKERDGFSIFVDNKNLVVEKISEIDAKNQWLVKIYQQPSKIIIISKSCCGWYGSRSSNEDYMIYEINKNGDLTYYQKISLDEYVEIFVNELKEGVKIYSKESPRTGKIYNYEYRNGKIYDYSTPMNSVIVAKESERVCKGFFNMFQHTNKDQNLTGELFTILSGAEYSWISHKVKTDDFLSDQLASLIKITSIQQRKNMKYNDFKSKYCD